MLAMKYVSNDFRHQHIQIYTIQSFNTGFCNKIKPKAFYIEEMYKYMILLFKK